MAAESRVRLEPLWRIRARLLLRSFQRNWALFWESRIGPLGLGIILLFVLMMVAHPILMATVWDPRVYDPIVGFDPELVGKHPAPPSLAHPLGTDPIGRDVLSQLLWSTRSEFALGVTAALITVTIGTLIGAVCAYFGGIVDAVFMRIADLVMLFPFIALLMVLRSVIHLDLVRLALVMGVFSGFGGITITLKAQALTVKVKPYIEAAKVAGGSAFHIIRRHIIPNILPLSFLYMMFSVTGAVFTEAVLSYFGLLDIRMSWGIMIHTAESAGYLGAFGQYWWLWAPPGVAITLLCFAFYLVGRGLETVVNPRLRKR
ncbi:MAG: ABC transporter permease [Candidatus Bipolaricaulaceae bacterium]